MESLTEMIIRYRNRITELEQDNKDLRQLLNEMSNLLEAGEALRQRYILAWILNSTPQEMVKK